jgi:hypothetical protein
MSAAQWTRATYMDQTRAQADARLSARWTDVDVKYALGLVQTREWKRLLNANRFLRWSARTVTQGSTGLIALSALDSGSADAQERLYRIHDVAQGTQLYDEVEQTDIPTGVTVGGSSGRYSWYRIGDNLQCLPVESGASMTVWVSHLPTPMDQLSTDSIAVEFPRDYELLLAIETAAWLLIKGGAEVQSAQALQQMAEQIRGDMLGDLARESTRPMTMRYPDRAREWGG